MRFGEELRIERERRGISLGDVAVSTRVALHHLRALEADRFSEMPGGVFSRGIVRSYAKHCGLDVEGAVHGFVAAARESGVDLDPREDGWVELAEAVHRNRPRAAPRKGLRWAGVAALLMMMAVLSAAVFWLLIHRGFIPVPEHLRYLAVRFARISHRL